MNRRIVLAVAASIVLVLLWFMLLWRPQGNALAAAQERGQVAASNRQKLQAELTRLKEAKRSESSRRAALEELRVAVPDEPGLAEFIRATNGIAATTGVDFMTVSPSPPADTPPIDASGTPAPASAPAVGLSLNVTGGYVQVLNFVRQMNAMPRLVTVDSFTVSPQGELGDPKLNVQIQGRMFVRAAPQPAASTPGASQ